MEQSNSIASLVYSEDHCYYDDSGFRRYPPESNFLDLGLRIGVTSDRGYTQSYDGWWTIWDDNYFSWSRIAFQLSEERNRFELESVHWLPVVHPSLDDDNGVDAMLQDLLKDVTGLKVDGTFTMDPVMCNLGRLLTTSDDATPVLESLEFMGPIGISLIFDTMKLGKLMRLQFFTVYRGALADTDMKSLAYIIEAGCVPSLSQLSLPHNNLHADGVNWLALTLGKIPSLKFLDLSQNTDIGAGHQALAKAMDSGHLLALVLSDTSMGDATCEAYAKALSSANLRALKRLSLSGNSIGDKGVTKLAKCFEVGALRALTDLDLSLKSNTFTQKGLLVLSRALTSGQLKSLQFGP